MSEVSTGLVSSYDQAVFQRSLEERLTSLQNFGCSILDVKYQMASTGSSILHSALIVFEEAQISEEIQ